jgi:hypothetical protein
VIDFKYHLVSIIAVFLALAVGLVVGATALSGPALALLQKAEKRVNRENSALFKTNTALQNQLKADQLFGAAAAPRLLPGLLAGEKVVLVVAPNQGSSTVTTGLMTALRQAGATVTGTVTLNQSFLDTSGANEAQLKALAQKLANDAELKLPAQLSGNVGAQQAAARVLAASLLIPPGGQGLTSAASQSILSGLSQANYITVSGGLSTPAQLAVLVTPGGPPPQTGNEVLVKTAIELWNAGSGTVMAGAVQSAGPGSAISAETSAGQVSTVDNADTALGQIMTVQALRQLLDHKHPGQFGIVPQAVPTPAPTPSVTPTTQPTPSTSARTGGHK